jgi:hypothetical protein
VKVAWLTAQRCRGVRRSRCGVNSDRVGEVAGREECALKRVVVRGACDLDPDQCQPAECLRLEVEVAGTVPQEETYRDPTALYRFKSASIASLAEPPPPTFKLGVATFPATLLRLSAMSQTLYQLSLPFPVSWIRLVWCGGYACIHLLHSAEWTAKFTKYSAPNAGQSCKLQKGNAKERLERGSGRVRATGRIRAEARRGGSCGSSGWVQVVALWRHNGRR